MDALGKLRGMWQRGAAGAPAVEPARKPGRARVHAVRPVGVPAWAEEADDLRWIAVELTVTAAAPKATPFDLLLVAGEVRVGVSDARAWQDERWQGADELPLVGEARLRLLVALPPDAEGTWDVVLGNRAIGGLDLARADLAGGAVDEVITFDASGDCAQCGNFEMLSSAGYCRACTGQPACAVHEDQVSAGRCLGCREPHCKACLKNGYCDPCRADAASRPHLAGKRGRGAAQTGARVLRQAVDEVKKRQRLLIAVVVVAVLLKAGHMGYELYTEPVASLSEAQLRIQKMETVAGAVVALQQQGGLPANAAAIAAFMKQAQIPGAPQVIDAGGALTPGAVVYAKKGKSFELTQVDDAGKIVEVDGKPLVVTREAS